MSIIKYLPFCLNVRVHIFHFLEIGQHNEGFRLFCFVISEIPKLVQLRVWCRWHNFKWGNLRVPANEGKYVRWPQLHNCPKLGEYPFLKNKFSHNSCHVYSKWDKKKLPHNVVNKMVGWSTVKCTGPRHIVAPTRAHVYT